MKAEIEIDNYLTDEEKKEIAIDVFRERISKDLFKGHMSNLERDSEIQRIIGNISHDIVIEEMNRRISNYEEILKTKVEETLNKSDLSYYIFKRKDAWEKEESLGTTYIREEIYANKDIIKNKVREAIANYDAEVDVSNAISEEFNNMSNTLYELSDLFRNKNKK